MTEQNPNTRWTSCLRSHAKKVLNLDTVWQRLLAAEKREFLDSGVDSNPLATTNGELGGELDALLVEQTPLGTTEDLLVLLRAAAVEDLHAGVTVVLDGELVDETQIARGVHHAGHGLATRLGLEEVEIAYVQVS